MKLNPEVERASRGSSDIVLLALSAALWAACPSTGSAEPVGEQPVAKPGDKPALRETQDPFGIVYDAQFQNSAVTRFSTRSLGPNAQSLAVFPRTKSVAEGVARLPATKLHPKLQAMAAAAVGGDRLERVVITYRENQALPRFPEPVMTLQRTEAVNVQAAGRATDLVRQVTQSRETFYSKKAAAIGAGKVVDKFWLVNGMTVDVKLSELAKIAADDDVLYIEPDRTTDIPPDANPSNDVDDGRARIVSDPYFNLNLTSGWIGLLDTGVRRTHVQFNLPSHLAFLGDCVNGGASCMTGTINTNDDCWNHGTSSAGIITGNSRQGFAFRGVTAISLDSWKVYPSTFSAGSCTGFLSTTASVRAFQRAVQVLDRVIVAEMQGSGDHRSSISVAANSAFDAGSVVIAANGNNGPNAGTVNAPANAHKVIGVGNFDVQTLAQVSSQSRGPTADGRFKPDIQTPTNSETASASSDTALRVFTGTSGSTPYAGGAAALTRNWLLRFGGTIDPGQVYAQLILSGQQPYPFNNTTGAGPIKMPTSGRAWRGKVSVTNGATIDIPLTVTSGTANTFDGALWWPESPSGLHNDVDLSLISPSGTTVASSISVASIFERVRRAGAVATGTWKVRIRGYRVRSASQTVYWAAHVRN